MGRKKTTGKTPQSTFRLTEQNLADIDAVAAKLAEPTGGKPNRADAIRYGVRLALNAGSSVPALPKPKEVYPSATVGHAQQPGRVLLKGIVAAGDGADEPAEANTWVDLPEKCKVADAAYVVRGSSMRNADIRPGDVLYVRETAQPDGGDTVIAYIRDRGSVVKRLKRKADGTCTLHSEDGEPPDGQYPYTMGAGDYFYGTVVALVRDYEPAGKKRRKGRGK